MRWWSDFFRSTSKEALPGNTCNNKEEDSNPIKGRLERFVNCYKAWQMDSAYERRRAYPRYPFTEPIDIMIDEFKYPADILQVSGRDISLGGIGFYSPRPIPAGTELIVSADNGSERLVARAVTVHSTLSVGLFKVGARFII